MKILVVHHVEESFCGDEWQQMDNAQSVVRKILRHINRTSYDKIILTTMEASNSGYHELDKYISVVENWWFGYSPDEVSEYDTEPMVYNEDHVYEGHEWLRVYDWIKELKGHQISVCGGFRNECFLGLTSTLDHLGIKYKTIEQCVYG